MRAPYLPDEVNAAVDDYLNGDSLREASAKHGMSVSSVVRMLKRHGHKTRSMSEGCRIYSIDSDFFRQIDNHDKAQILGFICADGCVQVRTPTSGYLNVTLSPDDTAYLEWIKQMMKSDRPLSFSDYTYEGKRKRGASFATSQPEIVRDLQRLGVTPRKSLTLKFPSAEQVPVEFLGSFIRGYFEGDGSIYLRGNRGGPSLIAKVDIIGSVPFVEGLTRILSDQGVRSATSIFRTTDDLSAYAVLHITTIADIMRFHDFIYRDGTYRMERKLTKFLKFRAQYREIVTETTADPTKEYELLQRKAFSAETKVRMRKANQVRGFATARSMFIKDPFGKFYVADAIKPFCREYGLHHGHVIAVIDNVRLVHKGWTKPTEAEIAAARATGSLIEKIYRVPPIP